MCIRDRSKTLIFLQENKIGSIEEMQERVNAATARYHELGDFITVSYTHLDVKRNVGDLILTQLHMLLVVDQVGDIDRNVVDLSLIHI